MESTTKRLMPLNLQFFADEGEGESETTTETTAPTEGESQAKETAKPTLTLDLNALLKGNKALQSQFDKQVSKALDTAKGKWEAEKNLTAEQLVQQKAQDREKELADREAELTRRELRATALEQMSQKGMPAELIDAISVTDEAAMAASLEKAEKAFRAAVDRAVKDKLKGGTPKDTPADPKATHMAAMRAAAGLKPPKT